jgi:branched-chain amino acid transport system permease protein
MEVAVTTGINVLVLSSMYILVALGFAFLFSIMGILNFAHGAIYMVGGYICYQFAVEYGLNQWLSLLLSVIIVGAFVLIFGKAKLLRVFRDDEMEFLLQFRQWRLFEK